MILTNEQAATIHKVLRDSKTIAVVGLSPKPHRPSHQVASYLMEVGYTIIPVNPGQNTILGRTCYPNLRAIPTPVDMVDIFRRQEAVLPIVEDAISIGAQFSSKSGISRPHSDYEPLHQNRPHEPAVIFSNYCYFPSS
jgi:predicted CoA-binding protein